MGVWFYSSIQGVQFSKHHCPCCLWPLCQISDCIVMCRNSWVFYFVLLIEMSAFVPIPYCLSYSFIIYIEIWEVFLPAFLLCKNPFIFYNFYGSTWISDCKDFDWDCSALLIWVEWSFNNINFTNLGAWLVLLFSSVFLSLSFQRFKVFMIMVFQ